MICVYDEVRVGKVTGWGCFYLRFAFIHNPLRKEWVLDPVAFLGLNEIALLQQALVGTVARAGWDMAVCDAFQLFFDEDELQNQFTVFAT